jgi:FkbM family methyltransferase
LSDLKTFQLQPSLYEDIVADVIGLWPAGGVHVDGGAHIGHHTDFMLRRRDVDRVVAVEAIPELCDRIARRFSGQARLDLRSCALGRSAGEASFKIGADALGYSGLRERQIAAVKTWRTIAVPVHTVDDVVGQRDLARVGVIKLDLEGGEFDALRGAMQTIQSSRPAIVFENGLRTPAGLYGYAWEDLAAWMDAVGYAVHDFFGTPLDRAVWDAPLKTYMFVALPRTADAQAWRTEVLGARVSQRAAARRAQGQSPG